jgi:hypothetical protein
MNNGGEDLHWQIDLTSIKPWISSVVPDSGTNDRYVAVTVDRTKLGLINDSETLTITSNAGPQDITINISQVGIQLPQEWQYLANTRSRATVVIPLGINPTVDGNAIAVGNYIGAFTPSDLCCGWGTWTDQGLSMIVWGDNPQTGLTDGFTAGEAILYRVYQPVTQQEWDWVDVGYSQGDGTFSEDAVLILNQFDASATGVDDLTHGKNYSFDLSPGFPNPFNAETIIQYQIPESGDVQLIVYNLQGQAVRHLVHEKIRAGQHNVAWDGRDDMGRDLASGVYFYRLEMKGQSRSQKITLLR